MKTFFTSNKLGDSLYRSILSILLGVILLLVKGDIIKYMIMIFGVLFLLTGSISLYYYNKNKNNESGNLISLSGIGSIILGVFLITCPNFFNTVFMAMLGIILTIVSIAQIYTLYASRKFGKISTWLYFLPIILLILGLIIIFKPQNTQDTLIKLFGIAIIFYGITDIINILTIGKIKKRYDKEHKFDKFDNTAKDVEDAKIIDDTVDDN